MRYQLMTERRLNGNTFIIDTLNDGRKIDVTGHGKNAQGIVDFLNDGIVKWEHIHPKPREVKKPEPSKEEEPKQFSPELLREMLSTILAMSLELANLRQHQEIMTRAIDRLIDQQKDNVTVGDIKTVLAKQLQGNPFMPK